jgi:hypothetical protein
VTSVAAWGEKRLGNHIKACILNSRFKCMLRVVAMIHSNMARNAEVIVRTTGASDEVLLGEF